MSLKELIYGYKCYQKYKRIMEKIDDRIDHYVKIRDFKLAHSYWKKGFRVKAIWRSHNGK